MLNTLFIRQKKTPLHTLKTRLGNIDVTAENIYFFPNGIYGFSEEHHFIISPLPNAESSSPFFIMQSLDNEDLCFVILNCNMNFNGNVATSPHMLLAEDIEHVALSVNASEEDLGFGFLVSIHHEHNKKMTVNTMAPLFFNIERKTGWQEVLNSPHYSITQPLGKL
jgi:flagellar assembly factor FliW